MMVVGDGPAATGGERGPGNAGGRSDALDSMAGEYEEIFSPLRIRNVELRNRVVVPAIHQVRHILSPEGIAWHRRLAAGGAALVIVERVPVSCFGADMTAEALRPLVEAIHSGGAAAAIQLLAAIDGDQPPPDEPSHRQIETMVDRSARAAVVCRDAGFDGVEPHGAHNTLLNRFFMPDWNHRDDEFGGPLANRCRLADRIVRRIRAAAGDELLILYRHTPVGAEYGMDESLHLAQQLIQAGLDVLDISPAQGASVADLAAPFKARCAVPVIAVGDMEDPRKAAGALRERRCDLIAICRQMIADAHWPNKVRRGRLDEIVRCTKCDEACFGNLREHKPVECVSWADDELTPYIQ